MGPSLGSVACNAGAVALLAPLFALSALALAVQGVASGAVFTALWRTVKLLDADPGWGTPAIAGFVLAALCALVVGCVRTPWLFPSLLLGGLAEAYAVLGLGLTGDGEAWMPALGFAGMAVSAVQVWRVA